MNYMIKAFSIFFIFFTFSMFHANAQSIEELKKGVVKIKSKESIGTGFIVQLRHDAVFIITAAHVVVKGDNNPQIEFYTLRHKYFGSIIIDTDDKSDIRVLKVENKDDIPDDLSVLSLSPGSHIIDILDENGIKYMEGTTNIGDTLLEGPQFENQPPPSNTLPYQSVWGTANYSIPLGKYLRLNVISVSKTDIVTVTVTAKNLHNEIASKSLSVGESISFRYNGYLYTVLPDHIERAGFLQRRAGFFRVYRE